MKIFIMMICFIMNIYSQERWIKLNGPEGGDIWGLRTKGDTIIGGGDNGLVVFSFNRGKSWSQISIKIKRDIIDIIFTEDKGVIAAAKEFGLFKSFDLKNWTRLNIDGNFWSVGKDKDGNIYAGTDDGKIYISADQGITWLLSYQDYGRVTCFHLTPDGILFAGKQRTILRKEKNSNQWKISLTDSVINTSYKSFSDFSANIYAYTLSRIFLSQDTGKTWQQQPTGAFFYGNSMYSAVYNNRIIGAFGDETGRFGDGWGVAVSDDQGITWSWSQSGLPPKITGTDLATSGDDTYLGTNAAGVFKSTDFGESWFPVNKGIYAAVTNKVISTKDGTLYAASWASGLSRSTDNGENWEMINNGVNNVYFYSIVSDEEGNLLAGSEQGVFRSTDKGNNWVETTLVGDNFGYELQIDRYNRIYCLTFGDGLYRTTDLGRSWERLDKGFISPYVYGMAIDEQDNLYAGTSGGVLYRSEDDGENWIKLYQSSISNSGIGAISISPAGDIFMTNHGEGILRSKDRGDSWELVKEDRGFMYPNFIMAINSKGEIFTKGSNESIYRSTDNGESWEDITSNLILVNVNNFTLDENDNLYLATDESVWRSNPDYVSTIAGAKNNIPTEYSLSQNYPNPFNPTTRISFSISEAEVVAVRIYDCIGKEVKTLVKGFLEPGNYVYDFNAEAYASGIYICRMTAGEYTGTIKMQLLK